MTQKVSPALIWAENTIDFSGSELHQIQLLLFIAFFFFFLNVPTFLEIEEWGLGGAMKITLNYSLACFITHDENNKKRKKEKKKRASASRINEAPWLNVNAWFHNSRVSQTTYCTIGCTIKLWSNICQISDCGPDGRFSTAMGTCSAAWQPHIFAVNQNRETVSVCVRAWVCVCVWCKSLLHLSVVLMLPYCWIRRSNYGLTEHVPRSGVAR